MQRPLAGPLQDLGPAAEAVGDDVASLPGLSHRREQVRLSYLHGELVLLPFETEGTRHAAATFLRHFIVKPHPGEHLARRLRIQHGLLVAVTLQQHLPGKPGEGKLLSKQKLAQQEGMIGHTLRILMIRQQFGEFVAEHGGRAGLQHHYRHPPAHKGAQQLDDLQ